MAVGSAPWAPGDWNKAEVVCGLCGAANGLRMADQGFRCSDRSACESVSAAKRKFRLDAWATRR